MRKYLRVYLLRLRFCLLQTDDVGSFIGKPAGEVLVKRSAYAIDVVADYFHSKWVDNVVMSDN